MHAVMMTSSQRLLYWQPPTLAVMRAIQGWRRDDLNVCYSIDAGPNVHVLCLSADADGYSLSAQIRRELSAIPGVEKVLVARPGGPARLV